MFIVNQLPEEEREVELITQGEKYKYQEIKLGCLLIKSQSEQRIKVIAQAVSSVVLSQAG